MIYEKTARKSCLICRGINVHAHSNLESKYLSEIIHSYIHSSCLQDPHLKSSHKLLSNMSTVVQGVIYFRQNTVIIAGGCHDLFTM